MKQQYNVTGMTCSACSAHVEKAVSKVEGVSAVAVSLMTNSMTVEYDEAVTSDASIIEAVVSGGYGASVKGSDRKSDAKAAAEAAHAEEEKHLKQTRSRLFTVVLLSVVKNTDSAVKERIPAAKCMDAEWQPYDERKNN